MKQESFADRVRRNQGGALIFAGSDSDLPHIEKIVASLKAYSIPFAVRICSAHKDPGRLLELIGDANQMEGALALIAVAGGTDALSGTLSFHAFHPVISCPPDAPNESCLRNPPGSSNATVYHPRNAARLVAQMFAHLNPEYRKKLEEENLQKNRQLEQMDQEVRRQMGEK